MARARSKTGWALAVAGLGLPVVACSILTSLDGLTGGAGDAGAPSDSPLTTDDANGVVPPADAGSDGPDASIPIYDGSAAADAAIDVEAGSPYCASLSPSPLFCVDFDEDPQDAAALAAPWDQVTGLGGTVTRSGGIVTSSPFAMLMTAAPVDGGPNNIDLSGYKTFAGRATGQLTLAFDFYPEAVDTTSSSDAVLAAIELLDSFGSRWALQLEVTYGTDGGSSLDVNMSEDAVPGDGGKQTYVDHFASAGLPVGAWTRVTMDFTVSTSAIALHFGTKEVVKAVGHPITINGSTQILVGGTYAQPSTEGWTVRYDNVTFNVK